jgi:hypothetical protein
VAADEKAPVTVAEDTSVCPLWVQLDRVKVVVAVSDPTVVLDVIGGLKLTVPETPTQVALPVAVMAVAAAADALGAPATMLRRGTEARHAIRSARCRGARTDKRAKTPPWFQSRAGSLPDAAPIPRFFPPLGTADQMTRVNIVPPFKSSQSRDFDVG